jgi:uncharacterized protein (TIGR03086 family)
MTVRLDESVELLERALSYTRVQLAQVRGVHLSRPTPCSEWRLRDLLAHMEDSLDAFTEAADGEVDVRPVRPGAGRIPAIQDKACALLGAWSGPRPGDVLVGDLDLPSPLLVATAALEVTVHGWDVGQATGRGGPIPAGLAEALLPVARLTVTEGDRDVRFAPARPVPADASADVRLLALLGRT